MKAKSTAVKSKMQVECALAHMEGCFVQYPTFEEERIAMTLHFKF